MKVGIFGDIHGNIYAFEKVWKSLLRESCDLYCFVGDICGYYYYQNEVIEILKEKRDLISVAGNHDEIFLKILKNSKLEEQYRKNFGKSYSILKENITEKNLMFLKKLPQKYFLDDYQIAIFHGSPWNHLNEYIYPTNSLTRFRQLSYKFIFLGHTHYPMDRTINSIRVINPGSSGQPRDCNLVSYAVLDYNSGKVKFKRIVYNKNALIKDVIRHSEENAYLIDVLKRSK